MPVSKVNKTKNIPSHFLQQHPFLYTRNMNLNSAVLKKAQLHHYPFFEQLADLDFVDAIYLYGSRARGDFQVRSDIDLAIASSQLLPHQWQHILDIIDEAPTLLNIDIIHYESCPKTLKENIDQDKCCVYKRKR